MWNGRFLDSSIASLALEDPFGFQLVHVRPRGKLLAQLVLMEEMP